MSFAEISAIRAESDEEKRKVIRDNIVKEVFPNMLKCLERLTQENNGYLALERVRRCLKRRFRLIQISSFPIF
jgi:hypothetical protein